MAADIDLSINRDCAADCDILPNPPRQLRQGVNKALRCTVATWPAIHRFAVGTCTFDMCYIILSRAKDFIINSSKNIYDARQSTGWKALRKAVGG